MNGGYSEVEVTSWVALLVRGVTLRHPDNIQIRQHKSNLLINASLVKNVSDEGVPYVNLIIKNCRDFKLTPSSEVHYSDFEGEWPPYAIMKELEKPQLVGIDGGKLNS